jgi:hypothetical protein
VAEVQRLIREEALAGYAIRDDGEGWIAHPASQGVDLFFPLEQILAFRANRCKWKRSDAREGDPALLPVCPLPSWGIAAVAQALTISEVAVRKQVRVGILPAYVINQDETGWTHVSAPDASPRGTLLFVAKDVIVAQERQQQRGAPATLGTVISAEEAAAICEVWQHLITQGPVNRQQLWQAMHEQRGWSKQRTTYNKVSAVYAHRKQKEGKPD